MDRPKAAFVVGTRPDTIKSAPVVREFLRWNDRVDTVLVSTGQHREMLKQALDAFDLTADVDLMSMRHGQSLAVLTARILDSLDAFLTDAKPDIIFAQGDTTTTFVASMIAFYHRVPFGHIEAGLRTETVQNPFPEEFYRRASALIARHHYAPTPWSRDNLLREGYPSSDVFVTGNTGIDAVLAITGKLPQDWYPDFEGRVILMTTHRRENWGDPQRQIAEAALEVVEAFPDTLLVVAMHKNPIVRDTLLPILGDHPRIKLIEPPDYARFAKLMQRSHLIFTDSGGVQEEAPAFGIPVLVLRENTERPEGVGAGTAMLVGTDKDRLRTEAFKLLSDQSAYDAMAHAVSPYGDGRASERIRYQALKLLGVDSPEVPMWA